MLLQFNIKLVLYATNGLQMNSVIMATIFLISVGGGPIHLCRASVSETVGPRGQSIQPAIAKVDT